jgi:hypothetical protein
MKTLVMLAAIGALTLPAAPAGARQTNRETFRPDAEGFIRNWLVLAPIRIGEESGTFEIDRDLIGRDTERTPKPGDRINVGGLDLSWTPHETSDFSIDFRAAFGEIFGEYVAAYAVAYLMADEEMTVRLAFGSNDQGKVWVNGQEVAVNREPASLTRDAYGGPVTLVRGQNVLLFKVINEVNNWQGCVRFLDGTRPVTNLTISLSPE